MIKSINDLLEVFFKIRKIYAISFLFITLIFCFNLLIFHVLWIFKLVLEIFVLILLELIHYTLLKVLVHNTLSQVTKITRFLCMVFK